MAIKEQLKNLPKKPGVYIMYDNEDTVIYVGKAKNLKNRVSQYFQASKSHTQKVAAMVEKVKRFEYIVTDTELEALVLECNLIKQYVPRYNILLKDDKGYPYIKVTLNEDYPRVLLSRKVEKDGAKYFGPYLSTNTVRETLEIIKKLFTLRTCKKVLPCDIGKGRECLNYYIKQCPAPCQNRISKEDYRKNIDEIILFLEGKHKDTIKKLQQDMLSASENLEFERAAKLRDRYLLLKQLTEKQKIISTNFDNKDIIAYGKNNKDTCIQIFFMRDGKIIGRESYMIPDVQDTPGEEIMKDFIKNYYSLSSFIPSTLVLSCEIEDKELIEEWLSKLSGSKIHIIIPKRGKNLDLVKMVKQNIIESLKMEQLKRDRKNRKISNMLIELKDLLGLKKEPVIIEAYDISNISGSSNVGVCVVFENAMPKKSSYKKFNIRSVEGADDYESMREVIYRRISNGIEGEKGFVPLPDLIFIDGGKGHVSAVKPILEHFQVYIPVFGIVKDNRHKTKGVTTADSLVTISRLSPVFNFLATLQDEVHRFAIEFHRQKRKKTSFSSTLDNISGVGPVKKKILLKHFKSLANIKKASLQEIIDAKIDKRTAQNIYNYFNKQEEGENTD